MGYSAPGLSAAEIEQAFASNAAPPPVGIDSMAGTAEKMARADHTHESRLQARRIQVTPDINGRFVYVFPKPYVGFVPIVDVTAETPASVAYKNDAGVLEGSTTPTQTTIVIARVPQTVTLSGVLTSLLGSVITLFAPAPNTTPVWVNIMSRAPS